MKNNTIKIPLYKEANEDKTLLRGLPQNGNAGLWYDKFCNNWKGLTIIDRQKNGKGKVEIKKSRDKNGDGWIDTVTKQSCGNNDELKRQRNRRWEMAAKLEGQNLCLKTDSPFVTGLGWYHPVENGFLWHHTLGVPYLSGSSVKGMVRAWIEQWADENNKANEEEINRIFGPRQSKQQTEQPQVGEVVFLDALPLPTVQLKAEVMTPHYSKYYQEGEAPGDWISPVPIPFLAVKEDTTFHFAIAPRRQACLETPGESGKSSDLPAGESREGGRRADCEIVIDWLKEALKWIGAGAKTAVGYGRMRYDKDAQNQCENDHKELREREEQKQKSEEEKKYLPEDAKEIVDLIGKLKINNDVKSEFLNKVNKFLADKEKLSIEACKRLSNKMSEFWPGIMEDPDAVKGKKKKPIYKERQRNLAKKLNALCKQHNLGEK